MNKSPARIALENYFAAQKELDDRHEAGALDNLNYQIYSNGHLRKLDEISGVARSCVDSAKEFLMVDISRGTKLGRLMEYDATRFQAWNKERLALNLAPTAFRILELREAIVQLPVPDPDPEKVASLEAVRNRQIGGSEFRVNTKAAAKDLHVYNKPPALLINLMTTQSPHRK